MDDLRKHGTTVLALLFFALVLFLMWGWAVTIAGERQFEDLYPLFP